QVDDVPPTLHAPRTVFPRVDVPLERRSGKRIMLFAAVLIGAVLLGGYVAWKIRDARQPVSVTTVSATPTPTPTPTHTPTPTPLASPSPSVSVSPSPKPSPKKDKESKVGSMLNKVKRILTK